MTRDELVAVLAGLVPKDLAADLVDQFLEIRHEVLSRSLGRTSAGKFVETLAQALQHIESGRHDTKPEVDKYFAGLDSRSSTLPEALRIPAARIARAMYTMRNKRNIAHKGEVDPNIFDLRFLHQGAQWLLSELLRQAQGLTMEQAGRLIDIVQRPAGGLVEDFDGKRLVIAKLPAWEEILVLLHSNHPKPMAKAEIQASMDRVAPDTIRKALTEVWQARMVERNPSGEYRLTGLGHEAVRAVLLRLAQSR